MSIGDVGSRRSRETAWWVVKVYCRTDGNLTLLVFLSILSFLVFVSLVMMELLEFSGFACLFFDRRGRPRTPDLPRQYIASKLPSFAVVIPKGDNLCKHKYVVHHFHSGGCLSAGCALLHRMHA